MLYYQVLYPTSFLYIGKLIRFEFWQRNIFKICSIVSLIFKIICLIHWRKKKNRKLLENYELTSTYTLVLEQCLVRRKECDHPINSLLDTHILCSGIRTFSSIASENEGMLWSKQLFCLNIGFFCVFFFRILFQIHASLRNFGLYILYIFNSLRYINYIRLLETICHPQGKIKKDTECFFVM